MDKNLRLANIGEFSGFRSGLDRSREICCTGSTSMKIPIFIISRLNPLSHPKARLLLCGVISFARVVITEIANGLFHQKKYDEAISAYQEILDTYPDGDAADQAMLFIGDVYFAQQKNDEAIEAYGRILLK